MMKKRIQQNINRVEKFFGRDNKNNEGSSKSEVEDITPTSDLETNYVTSNLVMVLAETYGQDQDY